MNESTPTENKSSPRKLWIVFGLIFAVIALTVIAYFRDDELGNHSDLVPTPPLTPVADLAFAEWRKVFALGDETVYDDELLVDRELLRRVSGEIPWKQEPVTRIIAANAKLIEEAPRADALGPFRFPVARTLEDPVPYLSEFQFMTKLLKTHAIDRWRAGDHAAAVEAGLIGFRIGDRGAKGSLTLIDLLVAITCETISASAFEQIVTTDLPEPQLEKIAAAFASPEPDLVAIMQNVLRKEFQLISGALLSKESIIDYVDGNSFRATLQFKPNRTINGFANLYRLNIPPIADTPVRRRFPPPPPPPTKFQELSSNAVGREILASGGMVVETILLKCELQLAYRRALRVKVALVRHQLEHGTLPATLAELVPTYLDAVPLDPFDGAPLRYDPARGIVWSIGKDLVDDGGATEPGDYFTDKRLADPTLSVAPREVGPEPEPIPVPSRKSRRKRRAAQP